MEEKPIRRVKKVEEELPSTERPKRQRIQKASSNPAELPLIPYEPKIPVEPTVEASSEAPVALSSETVANAEVVAPSEAAATDQAPNNRPNNRPDRPAKNFRSRKEAAQAEEAPIEYEAIAPA